MSQTAHQFDPSILREYDIRGIVGGSVHAADARAIGRTFGTMVRRKGGRRVALGYDGRLSSPELAAAAIEGLTAAGVDVDQHRRGGDADALFRRLSPERRRRHPDHGLAQSAGLQRLQDDDGQEVVLRCRHPDAGRAGGQGRLGKRAGQGGEEGHPGRLCRAAPARREARQEAQGRVGRRQRCGRRVASAPSSTSCRASISC